MNFFEHQDRARRQSRRLVFAFALAVLAVVLAVDAVLLAVLGTASVTEGQPPAGLAELVRSNAPLLAAGALVTLGVIGIASLARILGLKAGGGQVARQLGGVLVESDTRDPRRRQLRNVVEEIAIASGVPVPEIYVLEQESGINAFAAGYSTSDAAVAVTRGALEKLDRRELQGVIAHEFSHILNGDMRLNIRLMGALFGILLLALIGRRVLMHAHIGRSSRDKEGAAIVLIAFALVAIGYVGLFFGRWIKAAVSRQREYLADASAVQFTREPEGIGGALKKIAVYSDGSYLAADSEEISHMLFGDGRRMLLFSTHPPLNERIGRIEPGFRPEELDQLAEDIRRQQTIAAEERERASRRAEAAGRSRPMFDAGGLVDSIGRPDWDRMLMAAVLAASVPENIRRAAHSTEWAPEVLFYTLVSNQDEVREAQLLEVAQRMGTDSEAQVRALLASGGPPRPEQRLPLMEVAFPALKRRPAGFIAQVMETVDALIAVDSRLDVFEFLVSRVIAQHLAASSRPDRVRVSGSKSLESLREEALRVLVVLARHGHAGGTDALAAFRAGAAAMGFPADAPVPEVGDWAATLDAALPKLDGLKPSGKERLVRGLATAVLHDGRMAPVELELLRAACDLLHVPLPMLTDGSPD